MLKTISLLTLSSLLLSGCVDRAMADAKLTKGCIAGAKTFIDEGFEIKEIKDKKYQNAPGLGKGHREVTITALESDGWYEGDETYQCIFYEEFSAFNIGHRASIYQIRAKERIYGKEGDKIHGSLNEWIKLSETIEDAMH